MRQDADDKAARLKADIAARAKALGFDVCRVTSADAIPLAGERLAQFLKDGHHATMAWMEETAERRSDPRALWSETRSVIMLGMNYAPDVDPLAHLDHPEQGGISVYARHRDYHDIIKGKLKTLAGQIVAQARQRGSEEAVDVKVFVDTAPVMEKPLAEAAGLGWQGKHTNLVSRELGSWLFLGAIFTTLDLSPDEPEVDHCGSCRACLDACPTDAFPQPYVVDATRCLSYTTIELREAIPEPLRAAQGDRVFGCDVCQEVCPWNTRRGRRRPLDPAGLRARLEPRPEWRRPALAWLLELSEDAWRQATRRTALRRAKYRGLLRNALVAAGNSGDRSLESLVRRHAEGDDDLLAEHARWALERLEEGPR